MGEGAAYLEALWRQRPRSRDGLMRHQQRLWRRLQACFGDYPALSGYRHTSFADLPILDIADVREGFAGYTATGLSHDRAVAAALAGEQGRVDGLGKGLSAGLSTGTGGTMRGLFVTSPRERAAYVGQIMARLLTPVQLVRTRRVALCLRAPNALYDNRRLDLRFFPLNADSAAEIAAFAPDLVIAPSQVLLALAGGARMTGLKHLFYGAETLNDVERCYIHDRLGVRPDPIYQATEGFLGAPCRMGTLHLNEDALIIEREPLGPDRFRPIVTDLLRRSQAVVRLRLDDILQTTQCACGSSPLAVRPVEGRVQDIWQLPQPVFPRQVEDLIAPLIPADHPWIATASPQGLHLACSEEDKQVLSGTLQVFGLPVTWQAHSPDMDYPKRRHVRRQA